MNKVQGAFSRVLAQPDSCRRDKVVFCKRINKKCQYTFLFVLIVIVVSFMWWLKPNLRLRSEQSFRSSILRSTPLNSSSEQVISYLKLKRPNKRVRQYTSYGAFSHIGPVEIGSYWASLPGLPAITYVYVTWHFDESGRLIDVVVKKEIDAL